MMHLKTRALLLCLVGFLWSCQQVTSKPFAYVAEVPLKSPITSPFTVLLFDLQDKRPPFPTKDLKPYAKKNIEKKDPQTLSIWAKDSNKAVFGVSDETGGFIPLGRVLRSIAAQELRESGLFVIEADGNGDDYAKLLQENHLEYAVLGRIQSFSSQQTGLTPGQKAGQIVLITLFIAVFAIVLVAVAIAGGGQPGPLTGGKKNKNGKPNKSWEHNLELAFQVCHVTRGCFWLDWFALSQDSAKKEHMFDSLLPVVMQNGLKKALLKIKEDQILQAAPPMVAPTPTSVPSTLPKLDLRVAPPQ